MGVRGDIAVVHQFPGGEGRIPTVVHSPVSLDCQVGFFHPSHLNDRCFSSVVVSRVQLDLKVIGVGFFLHFPTIRGRGF